MSVDITKLVEKDVGRRVVYIPSHKDDIEEGIIKSWNKKNIFVIYPKGNIDKEENFMNYTAAATDPEDLVFGIVDPKPEVETESKSIKKPRKRR